jgi:hypothetical protein
MDDHPGHYRWSNYPCHAFVSPASIVKDRGVFLRTASTTEERICRYRALFRTGLDAEVSMMCEKQWRFLYRSETIFLKNGLRRH